MNCPVLQFGAPLAIESGGAKFALYHGKMSTNNAAQYEITHKHVSNDLKCG